MNALHLYKRWGVDAAVGGGGGSFAPTDVDGLMLWLDASDESTITHDSGSVSQWDDKSGNDRHVVQATGSAQPSTGTDTLNGLNAISHGNGDYLHVAYPHPASENTVFVVLNTDDPQYILFAFAEDNFSTRGFTGAADDGGGSTGLSARGSFSDIRKNGGTPFAGSTRGDLHTYLGTGIAVVTIEGVQPNAGIEDLVTSYWTDGWAVAGGVGAFLVYDGDLSTSDREAVEGFLMSKWGVS